ncbi:MAG: type II toxin-antitoxin system VapC family toxin [Candidatus Lokiarchaeota archaeon]|nr:type II toxin-antitoxin system VapC family toxin [Candidatus Lokiarchaeota archaeon]
MDTGVLMLFCLNEVEERIIKLLSDLENGVIHSQVIAPVLCELFFHLCRSRGREYASMKVSSLPEAYAIEVVPVDMDLTIRAEQLKCQYQSAVSYNDCLSIAHCLKARIALHTTEKKLKTLPGLVLQQLKIVKYAWD